MNIAKLDSNNFDKTISSNKKTIIVDFYADWCMPCKMLTPLLEEIAAERASEVTVYKVNVDENPDLAAKYSVMSIPYIVSFKNGQLHKQAVGVQPKASLLQLVD